MKFTTRKVLTVLLICCFAVLLFRLLQAAAENRQIANRFASVQKA